MSLSNAVNLNAEACADQVNHVLLDNPSTGLKMLDAWGKLPDGVLSGHFCSLGNYDQCINITDHYSSGVIRGKYCLVQITRLQESYVVYGTCIPEVCDLSAFTGQEITCQTSSSQHELDNSDCAMLVVLGVLVFLMSLSTLYDIYTRKYDLTPDPYYILLSLVTNGEKLFETKIGTDQISCLAGIRVLSMISIIAAHRYYMMIFIPVMNSLWGFSMLYSHESFYITAAYLAVDTFLFLGGLVLSYQCYKNRSRLALTVRGIPYFYLHRLMRLLPLMTIIFFLHITLLRRMASGPLYPYTVNRLRQPCIDHGWSFFLFYQNYFYSGRSDLQCLPHTWYLNVDVQLYLLTPLILIPTTRYLQRNQRFKCYCIFIVALLLSMFIPSLISLGTEIKYQHSHTRISAYVMGLLMGLIMLENKDKSFKLGKKTYYISWLLTMITMSCCVYYIPNMHMRIDDYFNANMFVTFARPAWCACISWIIFCCVTNNAKTLNKILSNSFFIVVGRLSYSMYLLQFAVLIVTVASTRTPPYVSFWSMFHGSVCDIVITILASIVCTLSFESPIIAFTKLLLSKREPRFTKHK